MIDFACKEFNLHDIVKCSLGLTRSDLLVLEYLLRHTGNHTTEDLAAKMHLDLSTVQRAMKKLHEKRLVLRIQRNLTSGGYVFEYRIARKEEIRKIVMDIVHSWTARVDKELAKW
jgi:predicted transcriptional regulator